MKGGRKPVSGRAALAAALAAALDASLDAAR